jgi:hypothetical protein
MFQKPDREGGLVNEPLLTCGLLTHHPVKSYDQRRAGCFTAQKFLEIEGPVVCFAIGPFYLCPTNFSLK